MQQLQRVWREYGHAVLGAPERGSSVRLYAATKKANELMAHTYSHLYGLPTTAAAILHRLRPWGRPDMSPSLLPAPSWEGRAINVFNHGKYGRDFTYIDDIVEGVIRVLYQPAVSEFNLRLRKSRSRKQLCTLPLYNIGNHEPIELMSFIETIEEAGRQGKPRRFCYP